jgi:hypothetical protein
MCASFDNPAEIATQFRRRSKCPFSDISFVCFILILLIALVTGASASDFSTLVGKHIAGYQGWFACPSDPVDPRWFHWFQGGQNPGPGALSVDLWPDLSEFDQSELCPTGMALPSGAPAFVFSSESAMTVHRHFRWMRDYGLDGVAVQRFLSQIANPRFSARVNRVLANIRSAAEAEGRGFFVVYDVSGLENDQDIALVERDWTELQKEHLTSSLSYIYHRNRPVVGLWGLGVADRKATPAMASALIRFFTDEAKVTVLGGVAAHWRTLSGDSHTEPEWAGVYRSFNIISPWTVGRFRSPTEADAFAHDVMAPDINQTRAQSQDYMPVIFPGFSWHNLQHGAAPLDQIPRRCGAFYKEQASNAIGLGAKMLYTAMFDEIDEGTAIFKLADNSAQLPNGATLLIPDASTCKSKNDLYLHIAGQITTELHRKVERK